MGYSISEKTHQKIEKNRREGRLCGGATRARHGCLHRATWKVWSETWTHEVGVGAAHLLPLALCSRHAAGQPVGFEGTNFRVTAKERF